MAVPKLRFKEFTDEYKELSASEVFDFYSTNSLSRDKLNVVQGEYKNIHYGDIHIKYPTILDVNLTDIPYINYDVDISNFTLCKSGDLIMADASEDYDDIGKSIELVNIKNDDKIVTGLHTLHLRAKNEIFALGYKGFLFKSELVRKQIKTLAAGAKVLGISKGNLQKVLLSIPIQSEQQKIADFLSLLDRKIALQEKKIALLKDYKKGVSYCLTKKIKEVKSISLKEILLEVSEKSRVLNEYPIISSTVQGLFWQADYFNREIASKDNIGYKILRKNQIVLSPQNLWMGNINYNHNMDMGLVSPSYKIFDIVKKFYAPYIGYIMKSDRAFFEYMLSSEQGASVVRRNLNMDLFYEITFNIPSYDKQVRVVKIINSIDSKITSEILFLTSLQKFKQALLQQMFI